MKHIYRYKDKGYVHMDSYPENHETHADLIVKIIMATVGITIAAITAGAMVGVDITDPKLWRNQGVHSTGR